MKKILLILLIPLFIYSQGYRGHKGYVGYKGYNSILNIPDIPLIPEDEFTVAHWVFNSLNPSPLIDRTGNGHNLTPSSGFGWRDQFLDYAPYGGRGLWFDGTQSLNVNSDDFLLPNISIDIIDRNDVSVGGIINIADAVIIEYSGNNINLVVNGNNYLITNNLSLNSYLSVTVSSGAITTFYNGIIHSYGGESISYTGNNIIIESSSAEISYSGKIKTSSEIQSHWNDIKSYILGGHLVLSDKDINVKGHWVLSNDNGATDIVNGKNFAFNGAPIYDGYSAYGEGLKSLHFDGNDDGAYMTAGDTPFFNIPAGQDVTWEAVIKPMPIRTNYTYHIVTGDVDFSNANGGFALFFDNANILRFWYKDAGGNSYLAGDFDATKYINTNMYIVGKYRAGNSIDMYVGTYDSLYHFQADVTTDEGSGGDRPMLAVAGYGDYNLECDFTEMRLCWEALPEETIINNWKLRKRDFDGKILDLESYFVRRTPVELWKDLSIYRNNFYQPADSARPDSLSDGVWFDGIDDYIIMRKEESDFDFTSGGRDYPFTFIAFTNPDVVDNMPFISKSNDTEAAYVNGIRSDSIFVNYKASGNVANNIVSESIDKYSIPGVYAYKSDGSMFFNGDPIPLNVTDNGYAGMSDVGEVEIGRYLQSMYYKGAIKALQVYKRDLPDNEIKDISNTLINRYPTPLLIEDNSTVAHWWLNSVNSNPLVDISGNGYDLTPSANFEWQESFTSDAPGGGKALVFDGVDDWFYASNLYPTFDSLGTLEMVATKGLRTYATNYGATSNSTKGWMLESYESNSLSFRFNEDGITRYILKVTNIDTSGWFYLALVVERGNSYKLYYYSANYTKVESVTSTLIGDYGRDYFVVGNTSPWSPLNSLEANVSELMYTDRAKTSAEIDSTWDAIKHHFNVGN